MNRQLLEKPFDPCQIKQRQGNFGKTLDYIVGYAVIARLNDAFNANWSFELIDHWIMKETGEVVVLGKLSTEGIIKMAFGSKDIAKKKDNKEIISLGDDLKAASTDALKKAATLLGVGLHLYYDDPAQKEKEEGPPPLPDKLPSGRNGDSQQSERNNGGNGSGNGNRITNKQLAAIFAIGKTNGYQNKAIKDKALDVFNKNLDYLTKEEASTFIQILQAVNEG